MNIVKDKVMLCQTSLADFSVESVNDVPFYRRWPEFGKLFAGCMKGFEFERFFAQPRENTSKKTIEWYYYPGSEEPVKLSELKESDPSQYSECVEQRRNIVARIKMALKSCDDNQAKYLKAAMVNLEADYADAITYCNDGHVLFGVWGMKTKVGRQIDSVITEAVQDHRAFRVEYKVDGEGKITPFNSINRRHGHILQGDKDIPIVTPAKGWAFVEWTPEAPHGKMVQEDITYFAVCKKTEESKDEEENNNNGIAKGVTPKEEKKISQDNGRENVPEEERKKHTVLFQTESHGSLSGQTRYEKYEGERISSGEIPEPSAEDGYEFIGWDKEPRNYEVHDDVVFTARYRKVSTGVWYGGFWHSFLHWLLLALLLALLGLLLWYLFGKHNLNFCQRNCDCGDDVVVIDSTIVDDTQDNDRDRIDTIHNEDDNPQPSSNCGVHFSGAILSDNGNANQGISKIFADDPYGEYVGQGYYPDNTKTFPKAVQHTFDAIAVDNGTRLIIYSKSNYQGKVLLDVVGPMLITNIMYKSSYSRAVNKTFNPELQALFPPERRQWSSENMHPWSTGSCKIICGQ